MEINHAACYRGATVREGPVLEVATAARYQCQVHTPSSEIRLGTERLGTVTEVEGRRLLQLRGQHPVRLRNVGR